MSKEEVKSKKSTKKHIRAVMLELGLYLCILIFFVFVVPRYVGQKTQVSGKSMENTLFDKDSIFVEKISYQLHEPKRFDVVVFYHFYDKGYRNKKDTDCYDLYVKRVIGLPGETVQIVDQTIYIDGKPLEEHYGKNPIQSQGVAEKPITLGEDEYFVLGDNRKVSQDSRYTVVGNVQKKDFVGRACFRIFPLKHFGSIQ